MELARRRTTSCRTSCTSREAPAFLAGRSFTPNSKRMALSPVKSASIRRRIFLHRPSLVAFQQPARSPWGLHNHYALCLDEHPHRADLLSADLERRQPRRQQPPQLALGQRHAAFGGRQAGARNMQEDGAAAAAPRRRIVPAQHADHVIDRILAPQPFVPRRMRQADRAVVVGMGGVVAPAILGRDGFGGQRGRRARAAIGAQRMRRSGSSPAGVAPSLSDFSSAGRMPPLPRAQRRVSPRKRSSPSGVTRATVLMGQNRWPNRSALVRR